MDAFSLWFDPGGAIYREESGDHRRSVGAGRHCARGTARSGANQHGLTARCRGEDEQKPRRRLDRRCRDVGPDGGTHPAAKRSRCHSVRQRKECGGRLATRRIGLGRADHGAQFFTIRTPGFRAWVHGWVADDLVYEWSRGWSDGSASSARPDHRQTCFATAKESPGFWPGPLLKIDKILLLSRQRLARLSQRPTFQAAGSQRR